MGQGRKGDCLLGQTLCKREPHIPKYNYEHVFSPQALKHRKGAVNIYFAFPAEEPEVTAAALL